MSTKNTPDAALAHAASDVRRLASMAGKSMLFRAEADDVQVELGVLYHDRFVKATPRPKKTGEYDLSVRPAWSMTSDERALSAVLSDADGAIRRQDEAALLDVAARLESLAGLPDEPPPPAPTLKLHPKAAKMLAVITASKTTMTKADIATKAWADKDTVSAHLPALLQANLVKLDGKRYTCTDEGVAYVATLQATPR